MKTHAKINFFNKIIPLISLLFITSFNSQLLAQSENNPNSLELTITGNGYSDQTFVVIIPGSTTGFDSQYDAYKLMGIYAAPQLYSIIPCCNLSVNAIPELYNGMEVQLGMRLGADNTYTIEANGLYTFANDTTIILEDTKENLFIDLMTDSTYIFTGLEADDEERFKLHYNCPMRFDIKVLLEGSYIGSGLMSATLDEQSLLPSMQPYSGNPWNYPGTEFVPFFPYNNVVDWVLLELRDAPDAASANAATMIERHACLLLEDGSLTGIDNETPPLFTEVITQNGFIVIQHRNHIDIMSSGPVVRNGGTYSWDFTDSESKAYGTDAMVDLGSGYFAAFSGDANADGTISELDGTEAWYLETGQGGYLQSDGNLDGQANNQDKNDYWYPNIGKSIQIP